MRVTDHRTSQSCHTNPPTTLIVSCFLGILLFFGGTSQAQSIPPVNFNSPTYYPAGSSIFVAVGDLNRDGNLDVVTADRRGGINVVLGNGDGFFQAVKGQSFGTGSSSVAVGDFNGDGCPDLAVTNFNDNTVSILLGNGDGTFQTPVNYPVGENPIWVAVGDFNRDGKLDLVAANNAGSNTVSVLLGNGDGSFQSSVGYGFGITYSVAVADFNGDGILDLAVEGGVLLGNGDGTFRMGPKNPSIDGFALTAGDFNHDGKLDLATATIGEVTVLLGNGDGTFQSATNYSSGGKSTSVAVGDFNLDGIPDLAVADQNTSGVGVLVGDGQGAFLPAQFVAGINSNSVAVADFNGDGRPDIAVAAQGNGGVTILINSATQTTLNATSTTLSASEMFAVYGKPVTFIASVNSFGGTPTGTIDIPGVGSGTAPTFTTTTNTLNAGSNSIIATYSGDSQFAPSNSPPVTVDVSQGRTSTAVSSSTNPSFIGQSLTYSATVTGNGPVTGSVTFNQNSTVLATVPLLDGKASYSILYTTAGRRKITVVYGGDQNNVRSSSTPLNQTVEKAPTTTTISSSINPSNPGQSVTFDVTVSSPTTGLAIPLPTGTVTLEDNGTKIGTGRLNNGGVSLKISTLSTGTHPITATYSGDRNYTGATSPILDQVVN